MKRREFVRNSILISGGLVVAPSLVSVESSEAKENKLTILHTNDTHSTIDPFPDNHVKYPGMGGVSKRFEIINQIRANEKNVLLVDAGDIFQGTPYFNKYGGLLEMKVMSKMGYDLATMGNHDFDAGLEGFVKAIQYANFDFVCSNYDFTNTPIDGHTCNYKILQKGSIKVGLFGVGVELKGLVPDNKYGETKYLDPIDIANDRARELKKQGCNLIICLSHLGYEYNHEKVSDRVLANKTRNIHLIIGGHTHTFLNTPTEEKNLDGEIVLVNQVGWGGINIGRLDFTFEKSSLLKKDVIKVQ